MRQQVLDVQLDVISYVEASDSIFAWAKRRESRRVCFANVHMLMEAHDDEQFKGIVNTSDLVVADGMPVVWAMRAMGARKAMRIRGPDMCLSVAERAAREGIPIGLYGGSEEVSKRFARMLENKFPGLEIAARISPPFRPLSRQESDANIALIRESGVNILLVGLGCPKQERWMASNRGSIPAVMLGLGAAFDFHSNSIRQAPLFLQRSGLEWLYRLAQEPKRLWKRYAFNNPRFVALFAIQYLRSVFNRY